MLRACAFSPKSCAFSPKFAFGYSAKAVVIKCSFRSSVTFVQEVFQSVFRTANDRVSKSRFDHGLDQVVGILNVGPLDISFPFPGYKSMAGA